MHPVRVIKHKLLMFKTVAKLEVLNYYFLHVKINVIVKFLLLVFKQEFKRYIMYFLLRNNYLYFIIK